MLCSVLDLTASVIVLERNLVLVCSVRRSKKLVCTGDIRLTMHDVMWSDVLKCRRLTSTKPQAMICDEVTFLAEHGAFLLVCVSIVGFMAFRRADVQID